MKALVHVQHLLGTGHLVRAARIGQALAARGAAVTLATGNRPPATADLAGLDVVALPPVAATDATFRTLVDDTGAPVTEETFARRRAILLDLLEAVRPDILLTETFPFGRRPFAAEIVPLLAAAREAARPPVVASSVRDILVARDDPSKERAMADLAIRWYDRVLVHADPALIRLSDSFPFAGEIARLVHHTGFVHAPSGPAPPPGDGEGEVIVSAGGGAVGLALFETAMAARALSPRLAAARWRLLVGGGHGEAVRARLAAAAGDGIVVEAARADFQGLLKRARLSVSQAGYNTVLDVLAAGCPAVLVPFSEAKETEQRQRAAVLAARGAATVLDQDDLSPARLAATAEAALDLPPRTLAVATDGAARSANTLVEAARGR